MTTNYLTIICLSAIFLALVFVVTLKTKKR